MPAAHVRYRLATVGLGLVLAFLAGLSILNATSTRTAADRVEAATAVSQAYDRAAKALEHQRLELERYPSAPTAAFRTRVREAHEKQVVVMRESLQDARLRGGPQETGGVRALEAGQDRYLRAALRVFTAVDRGEVDQAQSEGERAAAPAFDRLFRRLAAVADTRRVEAGDRVTELSRRGDDVFVRTLIAFSAGVLLLGLFGGVIRSYQQRRLSAERARFEADRNIAAVAGATRALSLDGPAARAAICDAALTTSGALMAVLWEPHSEGIGLQTSAAAGEAVPPGMRDVVLPFGGVDSSVVDVFSTAEPLLIADLVDNPGAALQGMVADLKVVSALFQPVVRNGVALGVLLLAWGRRVTSLSDRVVAATSLLADEAAVAIERAELVSSLRAAARIDELTGLRSRRAFDEELPRELARSRRDGRPVSVAKMRLEASEEGADRDHRLKQVADHWRAALRLTDDLVRYSENEFAAIFPACGVEDGHLVVGRLTEGWSGILTGVAEWDGSESADELLARVEAAVPSAASEATPGPVPVS